MDIEQIILIIALLLTALGFFYHDKKQRADEGPRKRRLPASEPSPDAAKSDHTGEGANSHSEISMNNPELIKHILTQLNCKFESGDDDFYNFVYQGENFCVHCDKDTYWVRIFDLQWFECPLDELDKVSFMQKAINSSNAKNLSTACYYIDTDNKRFRVYSKCDFLLNAKFPAPVQYFEAWLIQLFRLKHDVVVRYDAEMAKETADK
jgi:hypothetical protein